MDISIEALKAKCERMKGLLNERQERLWAAAEAQSLGRGGTVLVKRLMGMSSRRLARGHRELQDAGEALAQGRVRRPGAGRKKLVDQDATLARDLETLIEPTTRGDPESPLRWTCKSTRRLAKELQVKQHEISARSVERLLHREGYSLQAQTKQLEGTTHPDRNAQFTHINATTWDFQQRGQPVISVDTKKKELVGQYKNGGREWHPKGKAPKVKVHDFPDGTLGKAIPYGVYDLTRDEGWVSVGIDHDTAQFATASIRRWWREMGENAYGKARELYIVCDSGGSNSSHAHLWHKCLQELADQLQLKITVSHYPPGTSKWNKIEHRLLSFITLNCRGRALTSYAVIVNLIGQTRTRSGLKVNAALDEGKYPDKLKVSKAELEQLAMERCPFHGDWNYTFTPRPLSERFH